MTVRRFGCLTGRAPNPADGPFLAALYLAARPDLGALPVPRSVIAAIARHQRQLQQDDYALRYPAAETWLLENHGEPVARLVLDWAGGALRVVDLAVAGSARRQGIARTALLALQDECRGKRPITLRVRAENLAARALYVQCGFAVVQDGATTLELAWGQSG